MTSNDCGSRIVSRIRLAGTAVRVSVSTNAAQKVSASRDRRQEESDEVTSGEWKGDVSPIRHSPSAILFHSWLQAKSQNESLRPKASLISARRSTTRRSPSPTWVETPSRGDHRVRPGSRGRRSRRRSPRPLRRNRRRVRRWHGVRRVHVRVQARAVVASPAIQRSRRPVCSEVHRLHADYA